ncbi:MAG: hypothetical protein LAT50_12545, partial [Ectothiorhodospiraceae bacterium]|nr:hypothetical protein [Ectothiorhodospiraceae bacterium]
ADDCITILVEAAIGQVDADIDQSHTLVCHTCSRFGFGVDYDAFAPVLSGLAPRGTAGVWFRQVRIH